MPAGFAVNVSEPGVLPVVGDTVSHDALSLAEYDAAAPLLVVMPTVAVGDVPPGVPLSVIDVGLAMSFGWFAVSGTTSRKSHVAGNGVPPTDVEMMPAARAAAPVCHDAGIATGAPIRVLALVVVPVVVV